MSYGNLLNSSGKISNLYLPIQAYTTPTLAQVLATGNIAENDIDDVANLRVTDSVTNTESVLLLEGTANAPAGYPDPTVLVGGGSYLQVNATALRMASANIEMNADPGNPPGEIIFNATTGIQTSSTIANALELVATAGSTVVVSNKVNTGQVYDKYFNPPITIIPLTDTSGNIVYDNTTSYVAGNYQLQLSVENVTPGGPLLSLEMYASEPPSAAAINFSTAEQFGGATRPNGDFQLLSGIFSHSGGNLRIQVNSTGANWTSTEWVLQMIKYN